ncbi:cation/H+ exchanger 24 [Artemisia annua]|uniref:Cation/H+ exchanger 24 n=1 Tax=Artemisia annua TaxID=35608 RepID=A0A2U1LQ89_ARTAN|nr:cation/H+ exchanger 24 [Artemisia annua]
MNSDMSANNQEYGLIGPFKPVPKEMIVCDYVHEKHPFGIFLRGEAPKDSTFALVLLELSLLLVITHTIHHLLKPFKIPKVIAEILGGLIMGPSCLCTSPRFAAWMFPGQSAYIFRNIGSFAFMYFCFVTGVKMDLLIIKKATKKQWYIALFGMVVPVIATGAVCFSVRDSLEPEMAKISSIWGVSTALSITSFPVLYPIIKELNLLSSDIGRMALSTAVIGDVVGIYGIVAFEAAKQGEGRPLAPLGYIVSLIAVFITIFGGNRMQMFWIIKKTPEGKPVEQFYIISILAGVLAWGFISDFLGIALANGPMWFGLAIPDGPPLGATLVQKSESFISDILMPFAYINMGLMTNVFAMLLEWSKLRPLFLIIMTGYFSKFFSTLFMTRFFEMPLRDGMTLSLIMSLRGQVEFLLFIHWLDFEMIRVPQFTMFVLFTTLITSIITPLIGVFYNPNRPYMINKRRNIQHTPPNTELQIVVCFVEEESVPSMTHLLEVFNPTVHSPFLVYSLHLRELIGRAAPMFIDHAEEENESDDKNSDMDDNGTIHKAFQTIQETRRDVIKVHSFTSVAPKRSMYQDVCELALNKKACMIILPFNVSLGSVAGSDMVQNNAKSLNFTVLDHAPCSVAVLVDKGNFKPPINTRMSAQKQYHFAMLFLGGADAREALACADRMAGNPNVSLTVIRFLAHNGEGENEMEKKLDDGLVTAFWVKYEANEQVAYREVVVRNGEETVAAIRAMNSDYDLWIVGRKLGINPILIEGLSSWSESLELGVIGDYVASVDFRSSASVLVVQQQVLRDRETNSGGMQGRISRYFNKFL